MHRVATSVVLVLAGAAAASAQPVFRSGVDLVRFGVTVLDEEGELVSGLTADDFRVVEEGQEQRIAYFSRGLELDSDRIPLHLGVLFDLCQSLDLQLLVAAPEVAQAEGNTTYRLTREVDEDGREEVRVSGRRMVASEAA